MMWLLYYIFCLIFVLIVSFSIYVIASRSSGSMEDERVMKRRVVGDPTSKPVGCGNDENLNVWRSRSTAADLPQVEDKAEEALGPGDSELAGHDFIQNVSPVPTRESVSSPLSALTYFKFRFREFDVNSSRDGEADVSEAGIGVCGTGLSTSTPISKEMRSDCDSGISSESRGGYFGVFANSITPSQLFPKSVDKNSGSSDDVTARNLNEAITSTTTSVASQSKKNSRSDSFDSGTSTNNDVGTADSSLTSSATKSDSQIKDVSESDDFRSAIETIMMNRDWEKNLDYLSIGHVRRRGCNIKIILQHVDRSPPASDSFLDWTALNDSGCFLTVPRCETNENGAKARYPQPPAPGYKTVKTLMEFGIIRDLVSITGLLHDHLLQADGPLRQSYTLCYVAAALAAERSVKFLPRVITDTGNGVQVKAWNVWTLLDEVISLRLSELLMRTPFVRKTFFQVLDQVMETRFFKTLRYVKDRFQSVVNKVRN